METLSIQLHDAGWMVEAMVSRNDKTQPYVLYGAGNSPSDMRSDTDVQQFAAKGTKRRQNRAPFRFRWAEVLPTSGYRA